MYLNIATNCAFYEWQHSTLRKSSRSELTVLALWHLAFGADSEMEDPLPLLLIIIIIIIDAKAPFHC